MARRKISASTLKFPGKSVRIKPLFVLITSILAGSGPVRFERAKDGLEMYCGPRLFGTIRLLADALDVSFILPRHVQSPHVHHTVHLPHGLFRHTVRIRTRRDVDSLFVMWLHEAQAFANRPSAPSKPSTAKKHSTSKK